MGIRYNASAESHAELDDATELGDGGSTVDQGVFTGSPAAGRSIARRRGELLRPDRDDEAVVQRRGSPRATLSKRSG